MNAMEMNQDYSSEGSYQKHLDEEPNVDATKFLKLFKILMNRYRMGA